MNECIDSNNENEAMQYAMKKSTLENKINVLKDTMSKRRKRAGSLSDGSR